MEGRGSHPNHIGSLPPLKNSQPKLWDFYGNYHCPNFGGGDRTLNMEVKKQKKGDHYKVGPLPVITGFITPITRVIRTVSHLFSAIYRGYNSIYNWQGPILYHRSGEVLNWHVVKNTSATRIVQQCSILGCTRIEKLGEVGRYIYIYLYIYWDVRGT